MSNPVDSGPEGDMGFAWRPPKPKLVSAKPRKPVKELRDEKCDRCVAPAMFEIVIMRNPLSRMIYLCGHHFETHRTHLMEHGYEVKEV